MIKISRHDIFGRQWFSAIWRSNKMKILKIYIAYFLWLLVIMKRIALVVWVNTLNKISLENAMHFMKLLYPRSLDTIVYKSCLPLLLPWRYLTIALTIIHRVFDCLMRDKRWVINSSKRRNKRCWRTQKQSQTIRIWINHHLIINLWKTATNKCYKVYEFLSY